jgi:hypothetical protein
MSAAKLQQRGEQTLSGWAEFHDASPDWMSRHEAAVTGAAPRESLVLFPRNLSAGGAL